MCPYRIFITIDLKQYLLKLLVTISYQVLYSFTYILPCHHHFFRLDLLELELEETETADAGVKEPRSILKEAIEVSDPSSLSKIEKWRDENIIY